MCARPWGCRKQGAGPGPRAGPVGCREPSGRPSWRGVEGLRPTLPKTRLLPGPPGTHSPCRKGRGQCAPGLQAPPC